MLATQTSKKGSSTCGWIMVIGGGCGFGLASVRYVYTAI
jgi:hypothetical protein